MATWLQIRRKADRLAEDKSALMQYLIDTQATEAHRHLRFYKDRAEFQEFVDRSFSDLLTYINYPYTVRGFRARKAAYLQFGPEIFGRVDDSILVHAMNALETAKDFKEFAAWIRGCWKRNQHITAKDAYEATNRIRPRVGRIPRYKLEIQRLEAENIALHTKIKRLENRVSRISQKPKRATGKSTKKAKVKTSKKTSAPKKRTKKSRAKRGNRAKAKTT